MSSLPRVASFARVVMAAIAIASCATISNAQSCAPVPTGLVAWYPGEGNADDIAGTNEGTMQGGGGYASGLVGQAFNLDGANDYVLTQNRAVAQLIAAQFTIEWWANPGAVADRPSWGFMGSGFLNQNNPVASYDSFLTFGDNASFQQQLMTALPNAAANSWTHYAVVDDGARYRVYVNGTESYNALITVNPGYPTSRQFAIGQSGFATGYEHFFKGLIDEFTIYSTALTATQVAEIYAAGATGKCNACGNGATQSGEECDDGNAVNGDGCDNNCKITACGNFVVTAGEQCDDGNLVDGDCCSAACQFEAFGNSCASDSNVCTTDQCDGAGSCAHTNNSAACDDGTYCNGNDTCSSGSCGVHAGDPCSGPDGDGNCSENCNEATDSCSAPDPDGSACDDSLYCNGSDHCLSGACSVHGGDPCSGGGNGCTESCDENAETCGGADPDGSACDDGLYCNGTDTCASGACSQHAGDPCDGGSECLNTCNEASDNCVSPVTEGCTPDGNVCTDDKCDGAGNCAHPDNTASCNDGVFCNGADTCAGGTCSVHPGDPCSGGGECANSCNESSDNCYVAAGAACSSDSNGCTDDLCNGAGACAHTGNSLPCDDGLYCNGADTCAGGSCSSHAGDPCPTGVECVDGCNEAADSCDYPDGTPCSDDGNGCTDDECNGSGSCVHPANSAPCNDGQYCNGTDTCTGGSCVSHAGDPCTGGAVCANVCNESQDNCNVVVGTWCTTDDNECTDDECNGTGACLHVPNSDPCDDGLFCNGADTCSGAACVAHAGDPCPTPTDCIGACNEVLDTCFLAAGVGCTTDGNTCTDDACDGLGSCAHSPVAAATVCRESAGICDVAETCDGAGSPCPLDGQAPDGTECDDGAACTIADQCVGGICGGSSMTCGDGNVQAGCGEECDDGGFLEDDGCDASCRFEACRPSPGGTCLSPFVSGKSSIKLKADTSDDSRDSLQWKWSAGSQTDVGDFGDPSMAGDYWLCMYDDGVLVSTTRVPAGGDCNGKPCWRAKPTGFSLRSKTPTIDGARGLDLAAGVDGKAKAQLKGRGGSLQIPDLTSLDGPVVVQLVHASDGACWTTTFSAPFSKQDAGNFADRAD